MSTAVPPAFSPQSEAELKSALESCFKVSPKGDCSDGLHGPVGTWDVSSVTIMKNIFQSATDFNGDISKWDVSSVIDMYGMFKNAIAFNGDISKWDVSSVNDMSWMFTDAAAINGDISKWDVSSVSDMSRMFKDATAFNCDISDWDVSRVLYMREMFSGATAFNQMLCGTWFYSKARKENMFQNSLGFISICPATTGKHTNCISILCKYT